MHHQIRSTYEQWAPEYDNYPAGRTWPDQYRDYLAAWLAVEDYLLGQQWKHMLPSDPNKESMALAPHGHDEPTMFFGDTIIHNDAETIYIEAI